VFVRQPYVVVGSAACACLVVLGLALGGGSNGAGNAAARQLQTAIFAPAHLQTAVFDPAAFAGPDAAVAFSHARATGATVARLLVDWSTVAPAEPRASSDPGNPSNPAYNWGPVDRQVRLSLRAGLQPVLCILNPPVWARKPAANGSTVLPQLRSADDYGKFMLAAARRYSGTFSGLPRVRYWQVLNEPNLSFYLDPQYMNGQPASPAVYRQLVNAAADAVHSVHRDNLVIAGGLSPFGRNDAATNPEKSAIVISPMRFMRGLLCMSEGEQPKPTCGDQVRFDVWSHHPYTSGGPGHHADAKDDVSLGDLPEMKALLDAAVKAGHVRSNGPVRFWVDEFSWDSNPPDPGGVPATLEAQWISEAMYEMWQTGISLVTWFLIRDTAHYQSGLYQAGGSVAADKPKATVAAFRFPFVGHMLKGKVTVWGRTPWGKPGRVLVEELTKAGWKPLGTVRTSRFGILRETFQAPLGTYVRARLLGKGGLASVPFPLAGPRQIPASPFGS